MIQIFTDDENPIPSGTKAVVLFGATWHEACVEGGAMDQVLQALADASSSSNNNRIAFGRVDAEANPVLTSTYEVTAVPTFVLLNEEGVVVEKVVGLEDAAKVTVAVQRLVNSSSGVGTTISPPAATTTHLGTRTALAAPRSSHSFGPRHGLYQGHSDGTPVRVFATDRGDAGGRTDCLWHI